MSPLPVKVNRGITPEQVMQEWSCIVKSFYITYYSHYINSRWPPQQNIVKSFYVASVINLLFSLHQSRAFLWLSLTWCINFKWFVTGENLIEQKPNAGHMDEHTVYIKFNALPISSGEGIIKIRSVFCMNI
jgi:hypothetical protein